MPIPRQAFFLVGPTAVGKTAVAHELARRMDAVLLSADSMLVYRGMDVGTAKPSLAERAEFDYRGLDLVDPDKPFSVGDYLAAVRAELAARPVASRPILVVGGTGLYVDCLCRGLSSRPAANPALRGELEALFRTGGVEGLQAELDRRAPGRRAELADARNPRRLIRAIELAAAGIHSAAALQRLAGDRPRLVGLRMDPDLLKRRIEMRVLAMYAGGLLEEADGLRARFPQLAPTAMQAIGYAEAWRVLEGASTTAAAIEATAVRTRQLAKRQLTWFRHQADVHWVDVAPETSVAGIASAVQAHWKNDGPTSLQL